MTDTIELAAIRARDARWVDPLNDYRFPPTMGDAIKDCRTLLAERDALAAAFDALRLTTAESADQLREERDAAIREVGVWARKCGALEAALGMMYDRWENGDACYEDADASNDFLGNAFQLSCDEEDLILSLLKPTQSTPVTGPETDSIQTKEIAMQPFQQRVVDEKTELDAKIAKLETFSQGETFEALPEPERTRLESQVEYMQMYSDVLGERIAAFT